MQGAARVVSFVAVVCILLGCAIGVGISGPADDEITKTDQRVAELESELALTRAQLTDTQQELAEAKTAAIVAPVATPEPEKPENEYTDGIYLVGEDIAPGVYRGEPTESGYPGYWARLSAVDGSMDAAIANGSVDGPFVLEVKTTDVAIELSRVRIWPK